MQSGNLQTMLQYGSQAMAVDFLLTEQVGFKRQSVSKQWPCRELTDQGLAFHPSVRGRWLGKKPGSQSLPAVRGDGGVEQLEQRMGADKIEIVRVEVMGRPGEGLCREFVPIEVEASHMSLLDLSPFSEPMNPLFQPGMIARDDEKQDEEPGERTIAGLVPTESVECNRAEQRGDEQDDTPAGKGGTGSKTCLEQPIGSSKQSLQRLLSYWRVCVVLILLHGRFDLTGWACLRQ